MRVKTSVTLSEDIAKTIDRVTRKGESRSQTIERLVREGLERRTRHETERRELAAINEHADELNAEAEDVLTYQVKL